MKHATATKISMNLSKACVKNPTFKLMNSQVSQKKSIGENTPLLVLFPPKINKCYGNTKGTILHQLKNHWHEQDRISVNSWIFKYGVFFILVSLMAVSLSKLFVTDISLSLVNVSPGQGTNTATLQPTILSGSKHFTTFKHQENEIVSADESKERDLSCWFYPSTIQVERNKSGYPSFWNYYHSELEQSEVSKSFHCVTKHKLRPINVSYDNRSILLNNERVLLLGGSMHPSRLTHQTWNAALDEAVHQGLNLITMYVIWAIHQPYPDTPLDFTFQETVTCPIGSQNTSVFESMNVSKTSCQWNLQQAIRDAANRGLFVHIRIGPFVCAEYSYGGIPEWVPLIYPNISMRRPNLDWITVMEDYVTKVVSYLKENYLFAYQGGPIILAQIENEIGAEIDYTTENIMQIDENRQLFQPENNTLHENVSKKYATMQDYADWCGRLVDKLAPDVVWTMCYGLAAQNTISTYNGFLDDTGWIDMYGETHRIQKDQPALWTEHEGGFQIWGDLPKNPSDYIWGRTARVMAFTVLRWIARGGVHVNFYMWLGGYNRGRSAAAGIGNHYAIDAPLCSSGQRHQPKFSHIQSLLFSIQKIAPILLDAPSALQRGKKLYVKPKKGKPWTLNDNACLFEYRSIRSNNTSTIVNVVSFVENNGNTSIMVRLPRVMSKIHRNTTFQWEMEPHSAIVMLNGEVLFDSSYISIESKSHVRKLNYFDPTIEFSNWTFWMEPVGVRRRNIFHAWHQNEIVTSSLPVEQTKLVSKAKVWSDYAWYETDFLCPRFLYPFNSSDQNFYLKIHSQEANAFIVFIDGDYVGAVDTHSHSQQNVSLLLYIGSLNVEEMHSISFLSESLGYSNLIGRWNTDSKAKYKGLTGDVILMANGREFSLTEGLHSWRMFPGLYGQATPYNSTNSKQLTRGSIVTQNLLDQNLKRSDIFDEDKQQGVWSSVLFRLPQYAPASKGLFLDITRGRGHMWLNGFDLGRYWNITAALSDGKDDTKKPKATTYSQKYYFIPFDLIHTFHYNDQKNATWNEIIFFDAFGSNHRYSTHFVWSWIEISINSSATMEDEIGFPLSCI